MLKKIIQLLLSCSTLFPHIPLHGVFKTNISKFTAGLYREHLTFTFYSDLSLRKQKVQGGLSHQVLYCPLLEQLYSQVWVSDMNQGIFIFLSFAFAFMGKNANASSHKQLVRLLAMLLYISIDRQSMKSKWLPKVFWGLFGFIFKTSLCLLEMILLE